MCAIFLKKLSCSFFYEFLKFCSKELVSGLEDFFRNNQLYFSFCTIESFGLHIRDPEDILLIIDVSIIYPKKKVNFLIRKHSQNPETNSLL